MAKKEKKPEVFFVGIRDPIEIRRSILESSREMLQLLQRFEKFKVVREEKHAMVEDLKSDIKNLQKLIGSLKGGLPKTELRVKLKREHKEVVKAKTKKATKKVQKAEMPKMSKKQMSELEKLESELGAIESKLSGLI